MSLRQGKESCIHLPGIEMSVRACHKPSNWRNRIPRDSNDLEIIVHFKDSPDPHPTWRERERERGSETPKMPCTVKPHIHHSSHSQDTISSDRAGDGCHQDPS